MNIGMVSNGRLFICVHACSLNLSVGLTSEAAPAILNSPIPELQSVAMPQLAASVGIS